MQHNYQDLIDIFHQTFYQQYNTKLVKGEDEPIYLPANDEFSFHRIIFAHGFYASAMHEMAHWSIAGPDRQLKEDWGYWYLPDGRTLRQQEKFESVELKPQAVEWAFCLAANFRFNVSADNLSGEGGDWRTFRKRVFGQLLTYFDTSFPTKAQMMIDELMAFYRPKKTWSKALLLEEYFADEPI